MSKKKFIPLTIGVGIISFVLSGCCGDVCNITNPPGQQNPVGANPPTPTAPPANANVAFNNAGLDCSTGTVLSADFNTRILTIQVGTPAVNGAVNTSNAATGIYQAYVPLAFDIGGCDTGTVLEFCKMGSALFKADFSQSRVFFEVGGNRQEETGLFDSTGCLLRNLVIPRNVVFTLSITNIRIGQATVNQLDIKATTFANGVTTFPTSLEGTIPAPGQSPNGTRLQANFANPIPGNLSVMTKISLTTNGQTFEQDRVLMADTVGLVYTITISNNIINFAAGNVIDNITFCLDRQAMP